MTFCLHHQSTVSTAGCLLTDRSGDALLTLRCFRIKRVKVESVRWNHLDLAGQRFELDLVLVSTWAKDTTHEPIHRVLVTLDQFTPRKPSENWIFCEISLVYSPVRACKPSLDHFPRRNCHRIDHFSCNCQWIFLSENETAKEITFKTLYKNLKKPIVFRVQPRLHLSSPRNLSFANSNQTVFFPFGH